MANPRRYAFQFRSSPVPAVTDLFMEVSFGAAGAPTMSALHSVGITSITRNAAGKYTILMDNKYPRLLLASAVFVGAAGAPAVAPEMSVLVDAAASAGSIQVAFAAAGVATDPANGEKLLMQITLKNSTVPVG